MTKLTKITLALALAIAASAVPAYVGSYAKSNPNFDCSPAHFKRNSGGLRELLRRLPSQTPQSQTLIALSQ
jgi:hypothetical protein